MEGLKQILVGVFINVPGRYDGVLFQDSMIADKKRECIRLVKIFCADSERSSYMTGRMYRLNTSENLYYSPEWNHTGSRNIQIEASSPTRKDRIS
ncbi:hypothetical protein T265_10693 [Opisthorchis viverrini]|uniref:Uncharacterized protein n=1 Tax=Opisthorchis viverrini TaxID=6198 RepID=A0A074Z1J3_OPIVI|nr:hypothetical protein T265_10693 [Opisthorchis viverrini]KER20848.1 hypothetical protein T265_10693 [Opisthorchis viverrini]